MQKQKILDEFNQTSLVFNQAALEKYVDFCLEKDKGMCIKGETSAHHILPAGKTLPFAKFSNLANAPWNKADLTYYDHYLAHYLLAIAINHISTYSAFCAMHNKDVTLGRLDQLHLIDANEYTEIYLKRNKLISQYQQELVEVDGKFISRAKANYNPINYRNANLKTSKRMTGGGNIMYLPGALEKMRLTKSTVPLEGVSIDKWASEKAAKTMKNEFIDENGNVSNIYEQTARKISLTQTKEFIDENGNVTTIALRRAAAQKITREKHGKWYILRNIFDTTHELKISAGELRKISADLYIKSAENYLGKSTFGRNYLTKRAKSHLIGLYVEKLQ